jgi:hypothetical protein
MPRTVITRVTETDFQTEDGRTVPHPVPFNKDEVPSVEEFQKWYDHWFAVFDAEGLLDEYAVGAPWRRKVPDVEE